MIRKFFKYSSIAILVLVVQTVQVYSQTYTEGYSYFGRNSYVEYKCGGLPLIISVPHGGLATPSEIADRTCGTNATDSYTYNLAQALRTAIFEISGRYPHVIINNLKRIKLDANRDLAEATCGDSLSAISWTEYHKFIDSAKVAVNSLYTKGLFIDLHGQTSHGERIELGYLITGTELQLSDASLNTTTYENKSSIRSLIAINNYGATFSELLRGPKSLGTMIYDRGYPVVPSADFRYPTDDFYNGGYNTVRHGSRDGGAIDAIQIECNREIRFDVPTRNAFAADLADILLNYLEEHYFTNLKEYYDPSTGTDDILINNEISFYPNPVSDFLHVKVPTEVQLEIYNLYGQDVYSERLSEDKNLSLSHLKEGIYVMIFRRNGEVVKRQKLLKISNN